MFIPYTHELWILVAAMMGLCVGSFLNVVIYRLPREKSLSQPKRSFCPQCEAEIPWYYNLPLFSWLWLKGRCGMCQKGIPARYFIVEFVTACLFVACWLLFSPLAALFAWGFVALLIAIIWIDAELMVIPSVLTTTGMVVAVFGAFWVDGLLHLGTLQGVPADWGALWWKRGLQALTGAAVGFSLLKAVILLGKLAFGKKEIAFERPVDWHLKEGDNEEEELSFVIDGEPSFWGEMFFRKSDQIILERGALVIDGEKMGEGEVIIRAEEIELEGKKWQIEKISSASGNTAKVVIPREAMGDGDPHLLAMIGAFLGVQSLLFVILASCLSAIVTAIAGRVGFGKQLPYGPFLGFGALAWVLGGWKLWPWYLQLSGL